MPACGFCEENRSLLLNSEKPLCRNSRINDYPLIWLADTFMGSNWQHLACMICAASVIIKPECRDGLHALCMLARNHLASVCVEASGDLDLIFYEIFVQRMG